MFCSIKNQHLPTNSLGGNQIRILWHIPSPIDLSRMVDFLNDLNARLRGRNGMAAQFATLIVI
jgi:hypothetical protein